MPCLFCEIAAGNIPSQIVLDDEASLAFLDNRPLFPGHCLLIPKQHVEVLSDLPVEQVGPLFQNAQLLARAVETGLSADGSFVAINNRISQSVPHLHVHVVPRRKKDGLKGFFWPRNPYASDQHSSEVQEKLKAAIAVLRKRAGDSD
ncbi:MAG: HIT family protein [Acidobacteriota bacterium]|nr:HIT family protein [Acidobacteriota bacterium]